MNHLSLGQFPATSIIDPAEAQRMREEELLRQQYGVPTPVPVEEVKSWAGGITLGTVALIGLIGVGIYFLFLRDR